MEKRIELEKRGRPANQIKELNLDNCRSTNIVGLTDEFTALEQLSLINVGLTSLKGFPKLPNLKKLELSDNRISNGLSNLSASTKLTHLNLSGNKIKDLEELKPLDSFKELKVLDLFNNEATAIDSYRQKIFAMIPSLVYLDGFDMNDIEVVSEISDVEDDEEANGNDSDEDGVEEGDDDDAEEFDDDDDSKENGEGDDDDDAEEFDEDDESEENGRLADVYNDDLENDENDDDFEADEHDGDSDSDLVEEEGEEDESPARGTKRKHEDEEDDNDG